MRISLVHNPTAGDGQDVDDVVKLLTDAGHEVRHRSSKADWKKLLQDPGDLVVAAGGDGTVRKVALAAADRGLVFAALPIGTPNNLAKTLGILGDARDLVVLVTDADRDGILEYLDQRLNLASGVMLKLRTARARVIDLAVPAGTRLHVDDREWPSGRDLDLPIELTVRCLPGAVGLRAAA